VELMKLTFNLAFYFGVIPYKRTQSSINQPLKFVVGKREVVGGSEKSHRRRTLRT